MSWLAFLSHLARFRRQKRAFFRNTNPHLKAELKSELRYAKSERSPKSEFAFLADAAIIARSSYVFWNHRPHSMDRLRTKTHPGAFGALAFRTGFLVWMLIPSAPPPTAAQTPGDAEELGNPWTGSPAVVETVSDIMARVKHLPLQSQMQPSQGDRGRLLPNINRTLDPGSASLQGFPAPAGGPLAGVATVSPFGPQN